MLNQEYRWVHVYVVGRMLGIKNPRRLLTKAIERGEVRQLGRGLYRINRNRVRRHHNSPSDRRC
jgi:hypothetical protein